MGKAYTIKEAQRNLTTMVRTAERGEMATITRHNNPVVYVIGAEMMGAIAETMEILANPGAMRAIRAAESGKVRALLRKIFRNEIWSVCPPRGCALRFDFGKGSSACP
jgi:prevent-host-death family protein